MTTAPDHAFHGEDHGSAQVANDEIKDLLSEALARFADADRRNETLLRDMHAQLETLRTQARDSRPDVPGPYRPGFERIEDGMALLASKIAETYAARPQVVIAPADTPAFGVDAPTYVPGAAPISHAFAAPQAAASNALELSNQPPLRSSVAGLAQAPRFGKLSSNVDTFDVIESVPGNPSEPWSQEDAAALSEIYSSRDMLFSTVDEKPAVDTISQARVPSLELAVHDAPAAAVSSIDRSWLDGRLAEIAGLIVEARPVPQVDSAIGAISERFSALEQHMTEALRGIARVEDSSGLAQIESHIADLSVKVEQVHMEMSRFDGLEHRLGEIETSVVAGRGHEAPPHSAADLHAVAIAAAEAAAGRVVQHAARDQSRADGPDRLTDVHEMLASYMAERRQGDEQTSAILDTLQQAMVHLLDRVDSRSISDSLDHPAEVAQTSRPNRAQHDDVSHAGFNAGMFAAGHGDQIAGEGDDYGAEAAAPQPAGATFGKSTPQAETVDTMADPIARQRASLQMSAQRAALAQREKQAALETGAAPLSKSQAKSAGSKPKAASGWARLMVRGLVLAVAVGAGAGAVNTLMPKDGAMTSAQLKSGVSPTAVTLAEQSKSEQTLASVSGEISQPSEAVNSSLSAVITNDKPKPAAIAGLMIQDQPPQAIEQPARVRAKSDVQNAGALRVSAVPGDAVSGAPSADADEQSKPALGLPPLTVGPLSLRLAAGNGDPSAEFEVASRLAEGKGTDQNLALAARWYQRSASKGFVQAQYRLGTLYERGLGVTKDLNRAKSWYQRAAEQGNVKSMHNLAVLAAGRSELAPDYETAVKWFATAAQNGLADSQFNLAVLTESGLGVAKDKVAAAQWYMIAARSGDRESIRRRDAIRAQLTKAELASVDAYVIQWQPLVPDRLANDQTAAGQAWKARQPGASAPDNG